MPTRAPAGYTPTASTDWVTKKYVDDSPFGNTLAPPVATGFYAKMPGLVSTTTGTPTASRVFFIPFWMGPQGYTVDAFGVQVTTAQSGGSVSMFGAIYPDDGTGFPDTSQRLANAPTSTVMTATGNVWTTFTTPLALQPGRLYWVAIVYTITTAPTTAPVFTCISSLSYEVPATTGTSLVTAIRAWYVAGTATPTTATTKSGILTDGGSVPVIALRRSA